jgi:signal transduction histidine kinase/DNA-binding response OmpR family regulator
VRLSEMRPRILIVDDDPEMIKLIRDILELMPSEILVAREGDEALQLLRRQPGDARQATGAPKSAGPNPQSARGSQSDDARLPVDIVLLDIMMPGEDGFHILTKMKSDPELQQIPVILITGLNSIAAKTRGLEMGADDYIVKPFDPQELLARVGVVARIRRTELMLRQRNQELAALDEINRTISSSLNLDEVLVAALYGLRDLVEADVLAVVLNDERQPAASRPESANPQSAIQNPHTDDWIVRASAPSPSGGAESPTLGRQEREDTRLEGRQVPQSDPLLQQVTSEGRSVLARDVIDGFWCRALERSPLDVLCVPLIKNDEAVGALVTIGRAGSLREQDIALVEHVAATLVIAVEQAWLFHDLEAFAEEVERSQSQLLQAEKMAAVGRLTASLAHEINNPLQAIQNSLHLASHKGLDEEQQRRFLEMAQNEVNRLVQIVHRMLDFYRPSSAMQPLDINAQMRDALAIAGQRLQQANIRVESRLSPRLPLVHGTANQLTQVFLNLIINGIEAMPEGGTLWVGTAYHAEARQVVAVIRDSGMGIPAEIRDHLFEPFHTSKPTGTGLGLAISYGIIERHNGVIEAQSPALGAKSPPGGGTAFIIRLPTATRSCAS